MRLNGIFGLFWHHKIAKAPTMKRFLLIGFVSLLALFVLPLRSAAQNYRFEVGAMAGASNYLGDIGGKYLDGKAFVSDIKLKQTGLSGGLFARYAVTPRINLNFGLKYGRIKGDDSLTTNPGRNHRNLSFRNDVKDFSFTAEYEVYEAYNVGGNTKYRVDYTLYAIGGFGVFMHNPMTEYKGAWVELQPLKTEGVSYSLIGFGPVLGFGMDFTVDRNYKIGFKLTTQFTNTDYLDDISTTYKPYSSFPTDANGQLGYELSDRRSEVDPRYIEDPTYPQPGPRGNPENNDNLVYASLNFSYVFKGKGEKYRREFHNGYIRKKGKRLGVNRFFAF